MKKYFFKFLALVIITVTAIFFTACSNDMPADNSHLNTFSSQSETIKKLQQFNLSLAKEDSTRGNINKGFWVKIFLSDARGAYTGARLGSLIGSMFGPQGTTVGTIIGATTVGGAASYVQYHKFDISKPKKVFAENMSMTVNSMAFGITSVQSQQQITEFDLSPGLELGLDSCSCKIGLTHNLILENIESIDIENLESIYNSSLSSIEKQIVTSDKFFKEFESIAIDPYYLSVNLENDADTIMQMFSDILSTNCNSMAMVNYVIGYYTNIVMESTELTEIEKENLFAGFAVAKYSYQYWHSQNIVIPGV